MGKKQDKKPGEAVSIPNMPQKELYQRVNFAIQASTYLHTLGVAPQAGSSDRKGKRRAHSMEASEYLELDSVEQKSTSSSGLDCSVLARGSMKITKKMVAHTQLKLDPSLKRSMCRRCGTYLIPGLTSRIRNRPNGRTINVINTRCLECDTTLATPAPPTTLGNPALDGPKRRRRRERISARSKVAFHEREKDGDNGGGHVLWSNDQRVDQWGQAVEPTQDIPPDPVPAVLLAESRIADDEDDEEAQFSMS